MGVGAIATLTDLLVLTLLANGLGLGPRVASMPALASGIVVQFVGNKLFAFEDASKKWAGQAALFLVVEAMGFVMNLVLFDVAVRVLPVPLVVVRLFTTNVVYFGLCLPLWSRIFARRPMDPGASAPAEESIS